MNDFLDQPLRVRRIHSLRSLRWLALGWSDFTDAPMIGLLHGLLTAVFGGLLLYFGWSKFWALVGAFSGFLMVAPVLSTGLYAVSRALGNGQSPTWATVFGVWGSLDRRLVIFGLLLMAAAVFASTLVTIPLLMDRPQVSVSQAVATSWRAVATNPVLSSLWAGILMSLTLMSFGSLMFLLILVLPVLGHASWHAYRDLVVCES